MSPPKTPLRYPGGKQKIWRFIAEVIECNGLVGGQYVEPFAGGAGVAIELLFCNVVSRIHLNDVCPAVYAFWHSVINNPDELCRRIRSASLTVEEWRIQREIYRAPKEHSRVDLGFAMFYLNRCNRSGILNGGVIGGLNQDGPWKMDARFSRNNLITRIENIANRGGDIKLRNWDAGRYLRDYVPRLSRNTLVYCDPPYFNKADRLYPNHYKAEDHERLAAQIQKELKMYWLVSYDNAPEILAHYAKRMHFIYSLQYNAASAYKGSEVFVASDDLVFPADSSVPAIGKVLQEMSV